jgi:alkylhydroperoxidase family enzyme
VEDYENSSLSDLEKTVMRLVDQMVTNDPSNKDELYNKLKAHFSNAEIVELTMSIGFFLGVGRINRFLDVEF